MDKLERYTMDHLDHLEDWYFSDPNGEWVRLGDVKLLLSYIADELGIVLDNLDNDKEHLAEVIRKVLEN